MQREAAARSLQQEVAAAEAAAIMASASQQMAELKAPPEEAAERCFPVTTWAMRRVLIQAPVTILRRRKAKNSGLAWAAADYSIPAAW